MRELFVTIDSYIVLGTFDEAGNSIESKVLYSGNFLKPGREVIHSRTWILEPMNTRARDTRSE